MLNNEEIKRVVIYMRVSTDEQAKEGFSLDEQLDRLRMYVNSREDWKLVNEYVDDGYTGRNINRPGYKRMFADIDSWDMVVVKKLDRIHRSSKNFNDMFSYLKIQKKNFVSQNETLDTSTAMGRFVMDIMVRIAQLESEQTGERVYDALTHKIKTLEPEKEWIHGKTSFGYIYNKNTKKITENFKELEKVKLAYQLYAENGYSMRSLAKALELTRSQIQYIIHNPLYAGFEFFEKYLRKYPFDAVISYKLFDEVQRKLADRYSGGKKKKKDHKPFQLEPYMQRFADGKTVIELNEKDLKKMVMELKPRHNYKF